MLTERDIQQLRNDAMNDVADYIEDLEQALVILAKATGNWNLLVSQDDEFLIDRLVHGIESK